MKKFLLLLIIVFSSSVLLAQQDAMFTHYMYNTLSVNPAYAGSRDALTVTALHRSQWVGFEGAPTTQTLTLHTPVFNENIGLGLSVLNDKVGPTNVTSINVDFAYKVKLSEKAKLSFGLSAGLNVRQNGLTDLDLNESIDQSFSTDEDSELLPNFGFGLYYSTERFYVGLSTPKLLENDYKSNIAAEGSKHASDNRHYYLISGFVFDLNSEFKLKPTTLIKFTNKQSPQLDLTASLIFRDKVWAGLMYRTSDAAGVLVGVFITPVLKLGYSFDWSIGNETFEYNKGSHEIMLMYDLEFTNKSKIRSPRYF